MCVAVPGKVVSIERGSGPTLPALVETGHDTHTVDLMMVPDASIGDYVITHSGFAVRIIAESEALEARRLLGIVDEPPVA